MSRAAHLHYPVASTSYHQPPSELGSRPTRAAVDRRQPLATSHPDFSHDIYIPESQEELNRVSIESRLLQPSGPTHYPQMRRPDLTSASSTFDTYDRIGREDDFASAPPTLATTVGRPSRTSNMPVASDRLDQLDADESLIPGVGRGVRSTVPSQTSYQERMRSLAQHRLESSPSKSPYRPGKYSSGYVGSQAAGHTPASSSHRPATTQSRPSAVPRQPHIESETESEGDSATDSGESDAINVRTATFNSTGNHRNFAATPAGHTATMTANFRQRPSLGQDTLDRIDFDIHTDTDGEHRSRRDAPNRRAPAQHQQQKQKQQQQQQQQQQHMRPRPDPTGPFASPRATNTFGMNAADYQQHLASRTLTSPALRTLIGDRSKSPDSPTPAPSIDGVLYAGKNNGRADTQRQHVHQQPRVARPSSVSAVSAFEDLARRLQRDVEVTRRAGDAGGEEMDDGSASNSGGSGFGPGSQASSARTRVEPEVAPNAAKAFDAARFNSHGYPAHPKAATGNDATSPWGVRLPDVTGLTSALGSPVKARDTVKHRPFDGAVGNQDARLEELVNLRCFVDGIQIELDRAGERILNLEQAQEQQSHEFQGLRSEMQTALKDVRASQPASSEEQLVQLILQKLQQSNTEQTQHNQNLHVQTTSSTSQATQADVPKPTPQAQPEIRETVAPQQDGRSRVEVVNRLYAELDKLRSAMEEQYRNATGLDRETDIPQPPPTRPQHAAYRHQDNFPAGRDPWDAIEALRLQVLSLADEVEGLNGLVLDHLVQPTPVERRSRRTRTSASRREERFYEEDAHPASDPVHPVRHSSARSSHPAYPRERVEVRTDPIDPDSDEHYHRRVSFGRQDHVEEYDRTLDAVAENIRIQRERQRRRNNPPPPPPPPPPPAVVETDLDENEISQLAETRASRATSLLSPHQHTHTPHLCTVCNSSTRSAERKASRRARLLQAERRREAVDLEESILLDALDPSTRHSAPRIGEDQLATLRIILQEHWDEFLHQRMLYGELADELKTMSPSMSKTKRRILAQHVLEAVELLELKADRICRLESVIGSSCTTGSGLDGESSKRDMRDQVVGDKIRKEAGSRQASTGSHTGSGSNRLKHAMESFERRSRSTATATTTGRNSPPTTLRL
ncbi:uncharacterized protein UTRI_03180_B [Ustilago trichophora]|uniref:Cep57 centrosome microtubule-binding domain-containing protein n=1 Tax=Ustilago trichophora TaxID=86804 RepID=A0A5C3E3X6_9BASI|nr:uncharacterized protein UTRI_03180_B [Ustilago trichophora]